jgi:peptidoglycan/LPS O-acetylase OafA/YrhL
MNKKFQQYPSLNGLRAVSILLILIHHLSYQNGILEDVLKITWLQPISLLLQDGQFGVNVFFVISGFLITYVMSQEEQINGKMGVKNFYFRRMLRIFPAYYFLLFVYFILQLFQVIHLENESWITALTYTKSFNWQLDWYTSHAWSLSIEEQFYIFWPLVFIIGPTFRKYIGFFLLGTVPLLRVYLYFHPSDYLDDLTIFLRVDALATGCMIALYKEELIRFFTPYWKIGFYFSLCIVFFIRFFDFPIIKEKIDISFLTIPFGFNRGTFANLAIGFILLYSVFGPKKSWFRFLNSRVINLIGILSYSLYLWQQIFIMESTNWIQQFPQNLVFIFGMTLFSYYLIEKPFLKIKARVSFMKADSFADQNAR